MILSDNVIVAIIASVPSTLAALGALIVSVLNRQKIEVIHKATNSMKDQLVAVTQSDAFQKGHTAGVADEKAKT